MFSLRKKVNGCETVFWSQWTPEFPPWHSRITPTGSHFGDALRGFGGYLWRASILGVGLWGQGPDSPGLTFLICRRNVLKKSTPVPTVKGKRRWELAKYITRLSLTVRTCLLPGEPAGRGRPGEVYLPLVWVWEPPSSPHQLQPAVLPPCGPRLGQSGLFIPPPEVTVRGHWFTLR